MMTDHHGGEAAVLEAICEAVALTPGERQVAVTNLEDCDCVPVYAECSGRLWRLDFLEWRTSSFLTRRSWLEATYSLQ